MWAELWASPQAVVWEELGWTRVVARYAQVLLTCEGPKATAAWLSEARQMEDRLGLSPMAMKRLMWEVAAPKASSDSGDGTVTSLASYRDL